MSERHWIQKVIFGVSPRPHPGYGLGPLVSFFARFFFFFFLTTRLQLADASDVGMPGSFVHGISSSPASI